jgi:hypothetical protein
MNLPIHRKIYIGLALACFVIFILIPDVIIELLIEFVHYLFELLLELTHVLFEMVESTLDKSVEHLFHTDMQETQVIVFYLMLIPGIYISYSLLRLLPPFCRRCSQNLLNTCLKTKIRVLTYWHGLTVIGKIKLTGIATLSLYLISLVFF